MAQQVKDPPAGQETQEMWACSLNGEDPLEEEMETHSKYSCLGNPMDRGAWWAAVPGVAKSRHSWSQGTHRLYIVLALTGLPVFPKDHFGHLAN